MFFEIRPLQQADLVAVLELSKLGGYSNWTQDNFASCFKPNYVSWVLCINQQVCAFLISLMNLDEIEILNLAVHPLKQRQGLAGHLFDQLLSFAQVKQLSRIHLEVDVSNLAAIALYEKYQFIEVGRRKNYYVTEQGMRDALLFSMELSK